MAQQIWIHFTNDVVNFELTRASLMRGGTCARSFKGLFVYKFTEDYPIEERRAEWAYRDIIFVKCDEKFVEWFQDDPLGEDKTRDEYLIPARNFKKCEWWRE